jgi:hypothetical protein
VASVRFRRCFVCPACSGDGKRPVIGIPTPRENTDNVEDSRQISYLNVSSYMTCERGLRHILLRMSLRQCVLWWRTGPMESVKLDRRGGADLAVSQSESEYRKRIWGSGRGHCDKQTDMRLIPTRERMSMRICGETPNVQSLI